MLKVALVRGTDHYQNVSKALALLKSEIEKKATGIKTCVIKPNFVSCGNQLAATH